jgi:MSHA pilin protein MshD
MSTEPRARTGVRFRVRVRVRQRGVTMIELILFIMIVGVALAAIISVMNFTTQRSADPVRRKQALMLAEAYLEEIELAKFSFCDTFDANAGNENLDNPNQPNCASISENWGPEANNERPFDNVNDYVAAATPDAATLESLPQPFGVDGKLQDANGNPLPLSGFTVRVAIAPDTLNGLIPAEPGAAADTYRAARVLRIRVSVSYDGQVLSLEGYRTRYAPNSL